MSGVARARWAPALDRNLPTLVLCGQATVDVPPPVETGTGAGEDTGAAVVVLVVGALA